MVDTGDGESPADDREERANPAAGAPAPDGGSLEPTDDESSRPADADEPSRAGDADEPPSPASGAEAVKHAAGSAGDETVPRSSGPDAWTAVEEQVRLSEEPWWEAVGAPPPHPEARPWHARDGAGEGRRSPARSGSSGGRFHRWFGSETRRRELLVAIAGLVALVLVVLTASAWLAAAVGGP